jgi:hypothetical protein
MANKITIIPYFIGVANEDFGHKYEVDKLVFKGMNLQGYNLADTTTKGSPFPVYMLEKIEKVPLPEPPKQGRPKSIPSVFKGLAQHTVNPRERDFKKGKILIRKGYLKKDNG